MNERKLLEVGENEMEEKAESENGLAKGRIKDSLSENSETNF